MFNKLVASEGRKKSGFWSPTNLAVSAILHVVLVGGLLAAGVGAAHDGKDTEEIVDLMDLAEEEKKEPEPEKPKEPEPPPPEPEPDAPPPVVKGFQTLTPPEEPPAAIAPPPPNQTALSAEDVSGIGQEGGVAKGVEGGVQQSTEKREDPPEVGTYELSAVEEQPAPTNIAELRRQLERNYPPLLRDAGVVGTVQVRFRVLENGTVDVPSITVTSSTHEGFDEPSIRSVQRLRFRPAKVNNRPVKVWVELPIQWQTSR
jgi:TonB family protein